MKKIVGLIALLALARCTQSVDEAAPVLRVAVAANAQYAVQALAEAFRAKNAVDIETVIASSGKLTAQIQQSAPYDLFLSADMSYPQHLYEAGYATDEPAVYAHGELILWTLDTTLVPARPEALLQSPQVRRIALAQARTAPYGQAAEAWLAAKGIRAAVADKLVFGESIAQVNAYLLSGAAEVGFTALSVVLAPEVAGRGRFHRLEATTYPPIAQGMVLTRFGADNHPSAARAFYEFVLSADGQAILRRFGYRTESAVPLLPDGK